jgi:hypothetical protein
VKERTRTALTLAISAILLGFIGAVFWWQDLQYSLPATRPSWLQQAPEGTRVRLKEIGVQITESRQPVLLHFFNPKCPCSRFNLDHLRSLTQKYRGSVQVIAILQGDAHEDLLPAFEKLQLGIPAVADPSGKIASELGVYATPQAVVLDRAGRLFYRGNYNTTRYCTNRQTEFARIALDAALAERKSPFLGSPVTSVAYGCPLPANRRRALERQ